MNRVTIPIDLNDYSGILMDPWRPWWKKNWAVVRAIPCPAVYIFFYGEKPEEGVVPCWLKGTFDIGMTCNNDIIWDHKGTKKSGSPQTTKKTPLECRFKAHRDPIVAGSRDIKNKKDLAKYRLHNRLCEHWKKYVCPDCGRDAIKGKTWWTVLRAPDHVPAEEMVAWLRAVESSLSLYYIRRFKRPPALALDLFPDFRTKNKKSSKSDVYKIELETCYAIPADCFE